MIDKLGWTYNQMSQFLKQNKVLNLEAKSIKIKPNNFAQTLVKLSLGNELLTVEVLYLIS